MSEKLGLANALFVYLRENGILDDPNPAGNTGAALAGSHGLHGVVQDFNSVGARDNPLLNELVEKGSDDCGAGIAQL